VIEGGPIQAPITLCWPFPSGRKAGCWAGGFSKYKVLLAAGALSAGHRRFPWRATALRTLQRKQGLWWTFSSYRCRRGLGGSHGSNRELIPPGSRSIDREWLVALKDVWRRSERKLLEGNPHELPADGFTVGQQRQSLRISDLNRAPVLRLFL